MTKERIRRIRKIIRTVWATLGTLALVGMFLTFRARGFDEAILRSDARVTVTETGERLTFVPQKRPRPVALLFFPGGMVEPAAYAPMARAVAEDGYPVFIVKLPFRAAPLEAHQAAVIDRARRLIEEHPRVDRWIVGGHSRGGAIAARFARDHHRLIDGLLLVGTSHPRRFDLSGLKLDVTKVYASNDGLASEEEVKQYAKYLPAGTHWARIEGGNHCQFGWYGFQLGDRKAAISRAEQQRELVNATLAALARVGDTGGDAAAVR
jgi:pimeloyl-ACP methyl ester carboxylesterase